jgi:tRNA threonylcarbamoyladenosine biosynthesis protein TsaB
MITSTVPDQLHSRPILAIDTSSAQGGVALYDGQTISTRSWPADRSHTTTLLTEIHRLLDAARLKVGDLAAIAVASGPGAFTGLRVGFGVAKGFHLAFETPLIGVSTLAATALPFASCGQPVVATVAAGRGRLVWAQFMADRAGLTETRPARNGTVNELATELRLGTPAIICGELDDGQSTILAALDTVTIPPRALRARQPGAIAELGWRRWQEGRLDDPSSLQPVYLSR